MRNAGILKSRFWIGGTGQAVLRRYGHETALVAIYLVSNPHSHMSGIYYLPLALAASELQMTEAEVAGHVLDLEREGFCQYDADSRVVWVCNMLAHQVSPRWNESDNRSRSIRQHLLGLPETKLLGAFLARYGISLEGPSEGAWGGACQGGAQAGPSLPVPPSLAAWRKPPPGGKSDGDSDGASSLLGAVAGGAA
ncbi:MAG: hypothetical protein MUC77_16515 [Chromatiaceae bacterium]|jgi:hypothetical protein|nr:hypothetical protein [Chromatiaceae bacterium]